MWTINNSIEKVTKLSLIDTTWVNVRKCLCGQLRLLMNKPYMCVHRYSKHGNHISKLITLTLKVLVTTIDALGHF